MDVSNSNSLPCGSLWVPPFADLKISTPVVRNHFPLAYLIVHFQYTCIAASELFIYTPVVNNFITTRCLHAVSFDCSLTDSINFQSYPLFLSPFPLSPSVRLFHTFRLSYHSLHPFPGIPQSPK